VRPGGVNPFRLCPGARGGRDVPETAVLLDAAYESSRMRSGIELGAKLE
jgi:hypothetical protein